MKMERVTDIARRSIGHPNRTSIPSNFTTCSLINVPEEIFFTVCALGILENVAVLFAVVKNKNLHLPMYYFICSLSVSDILLCLYTILQSIMMLLVGIGHLQKEGPFEKKMDDVLDSFFVLSLLGSIFSLSAIAADRYITIFFALRYHNIMTPKRAWIILASIWTFSGGFGISIIIYFHDVAIILCFSITLLLLLLLTICLYLNMFLLAQSHAKKIASLSRQWSSLQQTTNLKGTITLTILLGVFICCWSPFFLHLLLFLFCPSNPYCSCYISTLYINCTLFLCSSVFGPFIYAFRSPELRNTFKKMFCR